MRVNDDGRTVAAMDVLAPGIGEIIGGSQREERLDVLDRSMASAASTGSTMPVSAHPRERAVLTQLPRPSRLSPH
jgi:hypothetical protein